MATKKSVLSEISKLIKKDVDTILPRPFVPDRAGEQEEVVGVTKDEDGLVFLTWNKDNGGNRERDIWNQTYETSNFDGFTVEDLKEILNQLKKLK